MSIRKDHPIKIPLDGYTYAVVKALATRDAQSMQTFVRVLIRQKIDATPEAEITRLLEIVRDAKSDAHP